MFSGGIERGHWHKQVHELVKVDFNVEKFDDFPCFLFTFLICYKAGKMFSTICDSVRLFTASTKTSFDQTNYAEVDPVTVCILARFLSY